MVNIEKIDNNTCIYPTGKVQTYAYYKYEWVPYCFYADEIRAIEKICPKNEEICQTRIYTYTDFDSIIIRADFKAFEEWWLNFDPYYDDEIEIEFEPDFELDDE